MGAILEEVTDKIAEVFSLNFGKVTDFSSLAWELKLESRHYFVKVLNKKPIQWHYGHTHLDPDAVKYYEADAMKTPYHYNLLKTLRDLEIDPLWWSTIREIKEARNRLAHPRIRRADWDAVTKAYCDAVKVDREVEEALVIIVHNIKES